MTANAAIRCEMFCDKPIGPDGEPGTDDTKAMCPECREALTFVCRDVMPSIRKHGYYSAPDAAPEQELAAMVDQADMRPKMRSLLADLFGDRAADVLMGDAS